MRWASLIALVVILLFFSVETVTAVSDDTAFIEELQQKINNSGFHYRVAKNWILNLPPEMLQNLTGFIPPEPPAAPLPPDVGFWSMDTTPEVTLKQPNALPTSYDAMARGYVTPIKNQGVCGSCWIFAAIADLESDVAISQSEMLDFSEQEVGDCNIWNRFCNGGNHFITTNYLTKVGAANESCNSYVAHSTYCKNCSVIKNLDNWRIITGRNGESQIDEIKEAILNYGPVYSTMYAGDDGFKFYDSGVYEYWGSEDPDHAIEIIGWNDSLPHSRGEGAWLVKNSWGTDWGANGPYPGCAWVAYKAANIGDYTSAAKSLNNEHAKLYYHDEYGWSGFCYGTGTTTWGAVRFIPEHSGKLEAVDFWAVDDNMQYEIRIFDNISGDSSSYTFSNLLSNQTGTTSEPGYYSIRLDKPVTVVRNDDFIVQIKFVASGCDHPIPIEYYDGSHASGSGESYVSSDGKTFEKLMIDGKQTDIGIRARVLPDRNLGSCYDATDCTGNIIATDVPCYECMDRLGGRSWNNSSSGRDWCFNYCPACCDGVDNDNDSFIDYPADTGCSCCYDYTETSDSSEPCIPEWSPLALLVCGLIIIIFVHNGIMRYE